MKYTRILLAVFLLGSVVQAAEVGVILRDTITVTDTAAGDSRYDTLYTPSWHTTAQSFWGKVFWGPATGVLPDTNWAADSLKVTLQSSFDGVQDWTTWGSVLTILNGSSDLDTLVAFGSHIKRDSVACGEWWRVQFIYRDSNEVTLQPHVGRAWAKRFEFKTSESVTSY